MNKMENKIPGSVLSETTKCLHDFSCLKTSKCGDREMCEIEYVAGENILFLASQNTMDCPYRLAFGEGHVCRCPIHYYQKAR